MHISKDLIITPNAKPSRVKVAINFYFMGLLINACDVDSILKSIKVIEHREDCKSCAWPLYTIAKMFSEALHFY